MVVRRFSPSFQVKLHLEDASGLDLRPQTVEDADCPWYLVLVFFFFFFFVAFAIVPSRNFAFLIFVEQL
jgi:hypothetical protein